MSVDEYVSSICKLTLSGTGGGTIFTGGGVFFANILMFSECLFANILMSVREYSHVGSQVFQCRFANIVMSVDEYVLSQTDQTGSNVWVGE